MPPAHPDPEPRVEAVRRFNRFYTQHIGVLRKGLLDSPFSLTEVRLLYELARRERLTATDLSRDLGLDPGYVSRMLRGFEKRGLIERRPSENDGRQSLLRLTPAGRKTFAPLDARASAEVRAMLSRLSPAQQARLVEAMRAVQGLLGEAPEQSDPYLLRPHRPGDMGWIIHRHGALYAEEFGWDETFEALVAEIAAEFIRRFDPKRERCWIAEQDGEILGSVFLVKKSKTVAQLRLLLIEPKARGLGLGTRLVEECIRFARLAGYRKMVLWTNSVLAAARRIYERAGFTLVEQERHHSFGKDLVGEFWELNL
jgi:DNA-binding MarR family transcriptional regulator/N-acetylglutamate synthase-like GNAT family acetyltransferase